MLLKVTTVLSLVLLPLLTSAQVPQSIKTETEFVAVLCRRSENEKSRQSLLTANSHLVNERLWWTLVQRASGSFDVAAPEESLTTYEVAIAVARELQSAKMLGVTYYYLGRTYSGLNRMSEAIDAYEKSRRFHEEAESKRALINVLADLGLLYFIQDEYQKAKEYSERSLSLVETLDNSSAHSLEPTDLGQATALATLADIHLRDGNYDLALANLTRALALYRQLSLANPFYRTYVSGTLQTLGRLYTSSGDYHQALVQLNQALEIGKTLSEPNSLASVLNSIGVVYLEQEDYAQAKQQLNNSLTLYRSFKNDRDAARVLLNLAVVDQRQENYEQALKLFKESLDTAKSAGNTDVLIAAGEGLGVVLTAKKDFAAAHKALNNSLSVAKSVGDKIRQTEILWRTAQTYYESANYAESAALSESAVKMARASNLPKLSYLATTTLGETYAAQNKIEPATQTLKAAVEELEHMRYRVAGSEVESQLFLENKLAAYHSLVNLLIKQDKPFDALVYAESAKGRVLLDILSGGKRNFEEALSRSDREESRRLNRAIAEINHRVKRAEGSNASSLPSLYAGLDAARLKYQSFEDSVYTAHPDLKLRTGRTSSLNNTDITNLTKNNETVYLEFVLSKERVYLFVVGRNSGTKDPNVSVYTLASKPDELAKKVDLFHNRIANRHPDFGSIATELYKALIEPAAEHLRGINTICIIPDGFLWNLPFQALITRNNRYLVEDHSLFYTPSLSVLREMSKEGLGNQKRDDSLIAFGNPVIGTNEQRNEELCPLPEAETEVNSIAKSFGPNVRRRVFIGREASERSFRILAPSYATIHLATHGVLDNRQPLYSHLLLTKTEGDVENDGLLEAREIMNMNLKADLAVLSACETANGRLAPGEGVMGMSWAFFVAGTRSMVVSQWKVNSASTSQLMMNFYQPMESKQTILVPNKARSLQEATLRLMKNDRYRHPFYWGGFVLVGSNN